MATETVDKVDQILDKYAYEEGTLIQVLLDVQTEYKWLPGEVIKRVSDRLGIPVTYVYRVASYYKAMSLKPAGRHRVSVCLGTACHVRGGAKILDNVELVTGIKAGKTTEDMRFSLQRVNCLGCCAMGPVMTVDSETYGSLVPSKIKDILSKYD